MAQELRSIGLNYGQEEGVDDVLFQIRIVEKKRKGKIVYGRSLLDNEEYNNKPVSWDPEKGEHFFIENGDLRISISDIDYMSVSEESGYIPLSNTLWTWF